MSIEKKSMHVTPAGGNVFADLGFEPGEAASLKAESGRIISEQLAALKSCRTLEPADYAPGDADQTVKVFLDDERTTPTGWIRVYWPDEAIALLETGQVAEISLDHDLGDDERGTGYHVVLWIEEAVVSRGFIPPKMYVHSANSSARQKMEMGIQAINRLAAAQKAALEPGGPSGTTA